MIKSYLGISVINYKTWNFTFNFLKSFRFLERDNIDYHIILSDNSDGSTGNVPYDFQYNNVTVVRNSKNIGFGAAHNNAALMLDCIYFLVVNNDVEFTSDTNLGLLLQRLDRLENFGVCGVKHIDDNSKNIISAFKTFPSLFNIVNAYIFRKYDNVMESQSDSFIEVSHINGAFMLFNKQAFDNVGGFSKDYFLYFEDTDICYKLKHNGYSVVYIGKHLIKHSGGESVAKKDEISGIFKSDYIMYHKSMLIFLGKIHSVIYVLFTKYILVFIFFIKSVLFYLMGEDNLKAKGYWKLWIEIAKKQKF